LAGNTNAAITVNLNPVLDAYWEGPGWYAGGSAYDNAQLVVHAQGPAGSTVWQYSGLMFDLSVIPDNANITSAEFSIYLKSTTFNSSTVSTTRRRTNLSTSLDDDWADVLNGQPTPANRAPAIATALGYQSWGVSSSGAANKWLTWDIFAGGWVPANDLTDDFLTLVMTPYYDGATNYAYYASSNDPGGNYPVLSITYDVVPEPTTILCWTGLLLLTGGPLCLRRIRRRRNQASV